MFALPNPISHRGQRRLFSGSVQTWLSFGSGWLKSAHSIHTPYRKINLKEGPEKASLPPVRDPKIFAWSRFTFEYRQPSMLPRIPSSSLSSTRLRCSMPWHFPRSLPFADLLKVNQLLAVIRHHPSNYRHLTKYRVSKPLSRNIIRYSDPLEVFECF